MRGAVEKGPIFLRDKAFKAQQSQRVRAQVVRAAAEESPRGVRRCLRTESANNLGLSPRWREQSSSSFTEWSTRQPCGRPCEDTDLAMWIIFRCFTPWVSTSSSEL